MGQAQYNAGREQETTTVWYQNTTGSDLTLLQGQAVAIDMDDTNAPVTNTADPKNSRGRRVVKPATAVLGGFAGLVAASSAGKVVPTGTGAFIDIIEPRRGTPVRAMVKASVTKGSSALGITNAGGFNLVAHTDATVNLDLVAVALETVDNSTTAALTLVKFL